MTTNNKEMKPEWLEFREGAGQITKDFSGGLALQEFFNFLLLNNSALVRSSDNILHGALSDQLNPLDRCRGNML